jgi:hypothetical protein
MKFVLEVEFDQAKADAANAGLFSGPEYDDPVIGDGRALVQDIVENSGIDELVCQRGALDGAIQKVVATLDGKPITYRVAD